MIDTIKFKVRVSEEQYQLLNSKCAVLQKTKQEETIFRFVSDNMHLGSYERNVHIQVNPDLTVLLEFSAPKYLYGHNVYLLYPSQLEDVLAKLYQEIEGYFGSFPPYKEWILYRLDICYAWRLKNQDGVRRVMAMLLSFSYPRKDPYRRGTSIMFIGPAYSVKFYQKYEEFKKHDYKELSHEGKTKEAKDGLLLSEGVLRFEASIRRQSIKQHFGEMADYRDACDEEYITNLLNYYLKKYFRNLETQLMTTKEIHTRLITKYGKTRGIQLFQFYVSYFTEKAIHKKLLVDTYSRTQISKNLKDIRSARVGISKESLKIEFDFSIPSVDVVNVDCSKPRGGEQTTSGTLVTPTL